MKRILLSLLALSSAFNFFGQTAFTSSNEPTIGETRTMYLVDSNAMDLSNITGNGVTWNYGSTNTYANETRTMEAVTPASTGYASDFPGSTIVVKIQDFASTFMSSSASGRISQGYLFESVDFGTVKAKFTSDQENIMNYPFALNGQVTDVFGGNLSFTYQSIPQNPSCTGNSKVTYDGFGTLVQVNNIAVSNISRVHITDTTFTTIPIIGNTQIIRNQFEYYDLAASNKLPIFVHSRVTIEAGFPAPLAEINMVLSSVPGTATASINENIANDFKVFPNPAYESISIPNLSSSSRVTLVDLNGRTLLLDKSNNDQFNVSQIEAGIYLLKIENDGKVFTERLVIE